MDRRTDLVADTDSPASLGGTAIWVLAVQCLLALSWTMYVLFLPGMLAAAGIERRWFLYVLIADQLIFAACDWAAGVYVDRIAVVWKRVGRAITAVTLLSSAALLAMPWVADRGNATMLLIVIFVWAGTSSALRAPVFALLGRVRESARRDDTHPHPAIIGRAGTISLALVGVSLAGAIGPYLTMLLDKVDSRVPITVSAMALAMAGLWATRVEEKLPPVAVEEIAVSPARRLIKRRAWSLAIVVLIAAFGTQIVTAVVAQPLLQRFVGGDAVLWVAWFWGGFGIGLIPGTKAAASDGSSGRPLLQAALALIVACVVFAVGAHGDTIALLVIGIALAGAGWGVFTTVAFSTAVSLSRGRASVRGAGTASGMLFSALAVGTLMRLAIVAGGLNHASFVVWLPVIAWSIASVLLAIIVQMLWRSSSADDALKAPASVPD
jgi:hypothetical protein